MIRLIGLVILFCSHGAFAQGGALQSLALVEDASSDRYLAQVQAHTKSEIETLLDRAEGVVSKVLQGEKVVPIEFVLHGEEVKLFFRRNYGSNKMLVDRAAKLDAFNVIDIKVCETWMRINDESLKELYPFIETVPLGPAEENRLVEQGYLYF